jgi:TPR repeat protein
MGTEFNPKEAIRWYMAAANNGVPEAIAEFYRAGMHVEQKDETVVVTVAVRVWAMKGWRLFIS